MLVWLIGVLFLGSASLASEAPESVFTRTLPGDVMMVILAKLEFGDLYQASYVSKGFRKLIDRAIEMLYGTRRHGRTHLSYTRILHELDRLVLDAKLGRSVAEANMAIGASPRFRGIRTVLEDQFGYCIRYSAADLPKFCLSGVYFDILNDEHKASVLPYVLDQDVDRMNWEHFIRGFIELERFDLLDQVTFSKMTSTCFHKLMSVTVPDSVLVRAAKALQRNEPASELASLLALTEWVPQTAQLPESCTIPIFLLLHLHDSNRLALETHILANGLDESSIPFWLSAFKKEAKEASKLWNLVLKHGDGKTRRLVSAFDGPASCDGMTASEKGAYQAMLIRLCFSPRCNDQIVKNYEEMLKMLLEFGYHVADALLDCGQFELINRIVFSPSSDMSLLMDKIRRSGRGERLRVFVQRYFGGSHSAPKLLKRLVQRKSDDSYVQLVWESIQGPPRSQVIGGHCCSAPLATPRRLMFEPNIPTRHVREMLNALGEFRAYGNELSKDVLVLYMVMF